ncbi:MAG: MarR family winged helix-turn-helix transcriptional regulator [Bacteroidia bacterium]|nr:MarR family winged helix-turn-helix transcriptional regulator [Bacteroidia bacterium]
MKSKKPATPQFDSINPTGCVNAKLRRLHRLLNQHYQQAYKPFGLQGTMVPIMFMVGKMPGINQKTLADRLVLDQSTMSRDIQKLYSKGWIAVYKGDDPRNSELYITNEGYKLLEKVAPVWQQLHNRTSSLLGSFNIQLLDQLSLALQQMNTP